MSTDLRIVKTKQVIRKSLLELLSRKEISKITISELCSNAQINRKTFYSHYRGIQDVFEEITNELLEDFSHNIRRRGSSILEAGAVIRDIGAVIEQQLEFFKLFMHHNPDLFNNGKIKAIMRRIMTVALKNTGSLPDNEAVLNNVAEFAASGILGLYSAWFDGGCAEAPSVITEIAVDMVTRGLSAYVSDDKLEALRLK